MKDLLKKTVAVAALSVPLILTAGAYAETGGGAAKTEPAATAEKAPVKKAVKKHVKKHKKHAAKKKAAKEAASAAKEGGEAGK